MSKIKIYSAPNCRYCQLMINWFIENKIDFEDVNILESEEALNEVVAKTGDTGVPVIDIDGKIIVGYDIPKIKKALNLK